MKKIVIAFVASLYVLQRYVFLCITSLNGYFAFGILLFALLPFALAIAAVAVLLAELRQIRMYPQKLQELNKITLLSKLALVPFFVINFICWSMLSMLAIMPMFIMIVFGVQFFAFVVTYFYILVTSVYSITAISLSKKNRHISSGEATVHIIFQLIPVLDVIDYIIVYCIIKKYRVPAWT
ncbi:MAG: hypothetical protein LBT21_03555 [Oscillospiraceae bacterium]|jgi:hypothetical protein|nr:hypothetical protein [Oscillospiraceae bacterium]